MKKEFSPFELAIKLKVLGFDEPCFYWYTSLGRFVNAGKSNQPPIDHACSAPTFSQAFRWFREKHGLQGYIYSTTVRGGKEGKHFSDYCWHINGIDMPFLSTDARDMENVSYEEAELACLTKLIEIVENKEVKDLNVTEKINTANFISISDKKPDDNSKVDILTKSTKQHPMLVMKNCTYIKEEDLFLINEEGHFLFSIQIISWIYSQTKN